MTPEQIAETDRLLSSWRQGDVVIGADVPFIYLALLAAPTTPEAEQLALQSEQLGLDVVSEQIFGFMVVSQTCDVVRNCQEKPYVEVCPVISLPDSLVAFVRLGRISRFAALPGLNDPKLAADLERIMTIEKGLLVSFGDRKKDGIINELQARLLTETLGRKRTRAALPDDFTRAVTPMRNRILEKHNRMSAEGEFLRAVREIRVRSIPDWTAPEIEVELLFVFDKASSIPPDADKWVDQLVARIAKGGRIIEVDGRPVGLDQLSTASYLEGERLDLDSLSQSSS